MFDTTIQSRVSIPAREFRSPKKICQGHERKKVCAGVSGRLTIARITLYIFVRFDMDNNRIVSIVNRYLREATQLLSKWLEKKLSLISNSWWEDCVLSSLSYYQRQYVSEYNIGRLSDFDLAALLRITDKNWYDLRSVIYMKKSERDCVRDMISVRNNWAHCAVNIPGKDIILSDLQTIKEFVGQCGGPESLQFEIERDRDDIKNAVVFSDSLSAVTEDEEHLDISDNEVIAKDDIVHLVSEPSKIGFVAAVDKIGGADRYTVFIDSAMQTFYQGQIEKHTEKSRNACIKIQTLQSYLTAYQINNPSKSDLYSLNSARIDFVPYQFRPALKIIKSDTPRILIADSVGVGKTIETGLIIKELEARSELKNIIVICPKPLVAERKWELEMKRFDEDFIPVDSGALRQIVSDIHRDGEWPDRYAKCIIPYSILGNDLLYGRGGSRKSPEFGLLDLDPAPRFDMVVVDEAHHIRNSTTQVYAAVKYFCDRADAVVFLTATPLQTSDNDLYTLLNLLRPDVILDRSTFLMMSAPNEYISNALRFVRMAQDDWQSDALEQLHMVRTTEWGAKVICKNPLYRQVVDGIADNVISRDYRVKLITDIENLHSLSTMINRTRRQDIQDFCIRRSHTLETHFTDYQKELHNELLEFETTALSIMHGSQNIRFMTTTIMRQAASCIFGLAPFIRNIVNRRYAQILDDPEFDIDEADEDEVIDTIDRLSGHIVQLADNLPTEDPKFDSMLKVIDGKQSLVNNKIIIFSTFKHTLAYIRKKLSDLHYRAAQIDGGVKDGDRAALRERFQLPKQDKNAIDILLFTEVGSEGLDYQFCDMMINYDLPWNPMRIEQRIGRIDRRGQKSDVVNIYNMITEDTIDATIYHRCLKRIGVFERSIGDCSVILGEISKGITDIALSEKLSEEERHIKLEQMADNEVRKLQEMRRLENEEKQLFGFDLTGLTAANEIKAAENPWIMASFLQHMISCYLNDRIGRGTYIIGEGPIKQLRLSLEARRALYEDFTKTSMENNSVRRKWKSYLKGAKPIYHISFESDSADESREVMLITIGHPLVKQAAAFFSYTGIRYVSISLSSSLYPAGVFPFSLYAWSYCGHNPQSKIVAVCKNHDIESELMEILQQAADTDMAANSSDPKRWSDLEPLHLQRWNEAKSNYISESAASTKFRLESLGNNFRNRKRRIEQEIANATNENILRMKQSELYNIENEYKDKVETINAETARTDIHTKLLVNGILRVSAD